MDKKENYRKSVKNALCRCSKYTVRESDSSSTGVTYTTKFENKKGTLLRKMDILVNEEQETIRLRMLIEEDISDNMRKEILKCVNELQREWLYGRMSLSGNGDWMADYMMILLWQDEQGRNEFENNVYKAINLLAEIFMEFAERGEAVVQEIKFGLAENRWEVFDERKLRLNPFGNM